MTSVDLEIVILVDDSGSVNDTEFRYQIAGISAALRDSDVQDEIDSGTYAIHKKIALAIITFSGNAQQAKAMDWTVITKANASTIATTVDNIWPDNSGTGATYSRYAGSTAIGNGIQYAYQQFSGNGYTGTRKIIDVSGDGQDNDSSVDTDVASAAAISNGIDLVNGLVIGNSTLLTWYQENVLAGTGAFAINVANYSSIAATFLKKLQAESSNTYPAGATNSSNSGYTEDSTINSSAPQICLREGTLITTDQGEIPIENITNKNTISNNKIIYITKALSTNPIILMKKDSIQKNIPLRDTYITDYHTIFINNKCYYIKQLINKKTIKYVNIGVYRLFNLILDNYDKMIVNNLLLGTLCFKSELLNKLYKKVIENKIKYINFNIISTKKMGRNDMCFCGRGKKYKKCCGAKTSNRRLKNHFSISSQSIKLFNKW